MTRAACGENKRTKMRDFLRGFDGLQAAQEPEARRQRTSYQPRRRRRSFSNAEKRYELGGKLLSLRDLDKISVVNIGTLRARLDAGMPVAEACFKPAAPRAPVDRSVRYDVGGGTFMTVPEMALAAGVSRCTIYVRLRYGYTPGEAIRMGRAAR
jgi:hypothetical protein